MQHRLEIDGLRGLSIISVLIYHLKLNLINGGFLGVDIFFVISGYLITSIIINKVEKKNFSISEFWDRRIRRVFPGIILINFFCLTFGIFIMFPDDLLELSKSSFSSLFLYSNYFFWKIIGYFNNLSELKPLLHTWSLSIEEQFYLFFPLLLIFLKNINIKKNFILNILIVLLVLSFLLSIYASRHHPSANFYFIFTRVWEILLGCILVFFKRKIKIKYLNEICLIIIFLFLIFFDKNFYHPSFLTLFFLISVSILIVSNHDKSHVSNFILKSKILIFFGVISYSLYLWHVPIFTFYKYLKLFEINLIEKFILFFLSIFISFLSWRYIENPIRNRKKIKTSKKFYSTLIFFILFLSFTNFYILNKKGEVVSLTLEQKKFVKENKEHINDKDFIKCLLGPSERFDQLHQDCYDKNNNIIVWGDSTASAIAYGIKKKTKEKISIFASSSCPPLIDINLLHRKYCKFNNDKIIKFIIESNANIVILQAAWFIHNEYFSVDKYISKLDKTISEIRKYKKDIRILVVGDSMSFKFELPKILVLQKISDIENIKIKYDNYNHSKIIDKRFKDYMSKVKNSNFVPIIDNFCSNDKKCKVTIKNNNKVYSLLHDNLHFSKEGSVYFFETTLKNLIKY